MMEKTVLKHHDRGVRWYEKKEFVVLDVLLLFTFVGIICSGCMIAYMKTIYGTIMVSGDFQEELSKAKTSQNGSVRSLENQLKLYASMYNETLVGAALYLTTGNFFMNFFSIIFCFWGIIDNNPSFMMPCIFVLPFSAVVIGFGPFTIAIFFSEIWTFDVMVTAIVATCLGLMWLMLVPIIKYWQMLVRVKKNSGTLPVTYKSKGDLRHTLSNANVKRFYLK